MVVEERRSYLSTLKSPETPSVQFQNDSKHNANVFFAWAMLGFFALHGCDVLEVVSETKTEPSGKAK